MSKAKQRRISALNIGIKIGHKMARLEERMTKAHFNKTFSQLYLAAPQMRTVSYIAAKETYFEDIHLEAIKHNEEVRYVNF